jgi:signal transduction histidine kinase/CheY-like chemotaxis protein
MPAALRLLIVEDRPDDAELLVAELERNGYDPDWTRAETPADFLMGLADNPDIILCDYSLPGMTALDALEMLRERGGEVPLIVVSGVMDEETCVTSLRLGAVDYLLKDRLTRLGPAVDHALRARQLASSATQARRERRETFDILKAVLGHAPAAICVRDRQGQMLLSNPEFQRLGVPPSVHEQEVLDGGGISQSEEALVVDGEPRTFLCVRYPVTDRSGRPFAVGTIYTDISRQKRVEDELRELDRLKGEFVATVSHELRTPLTSISGYAEMLMGDPSITHSAAAERSPQHRMIEVIDRNSRRLLGLVDDLLTLSHVDSGVLGPGDTPVDVAELVSSAVAVLRPSAEAAAVFVDTHVPDDVGAVAGDRSQLDRVLLNLLSNAVKFSPRGGRVELVVHPRDSEGNLAIAITDHGMGIPADEQSQLFTRFFRTKEATRRAIQGTGLGLAVVREIVERHGGRVEVQSEPDVGTTMTVRLPVRTPELVGGGSADGAAQAG